MTSLVPVPVRSLVARILFLGLALVSIVSAQTDGVVAGQVSNAATGAFLEGAEVSADGSNRSVNTDREGRYELRLPPGVKTLVVRYTGLDIQRIPVTLTAGGRTTQNVELTSGVYKMQAFTVAGAREGNAAAIVAQREAMNVKNVVAADSFGNVADGNVGDFLQQLPGISAVYVGADVRSVQIRGIDGALNTVTMDGDQMASSQSAGAGRTFEFEQASLNNIASIEVTKAPTPDMDANSLSGNVNIISKSAFDSRQPRMFNYALAGVWRPKYYTRSDNFAREPIDNVGPSLNFSYQDVVGADRRIGVSFNATYHSQPGGDTAALQAYQQTLTEPYYVTSVTIPRPAGAPRTRLATGAKIQYKLSENTVLSLNSTYNWFHESNDTRAMAIGTSAVATNFRAGYTSFLQEVLPNNNSTSTITLSSDDKSGRTYLFSPLVQHRFPGMELDYGISFSNSQTYYEYRPGGDRHFKSRPKATISYVMRGIGFTLDRRGSIKWPTITPTPGAPDFYNLDNYGTLRVTQPDRQGEDEIRLAKLNLKKVINLSVPTFVKLGGLVREQERALLNFTREYNFAGPDGVLTTGDERLGQFLDTTGKWSDSNEGYRQPPWANPFAVTRHLAENPGQWVENLATVTTRLNGDRNITE
ncbi:MAG: carboxypeptidase regulatory-like domain-containing protein, partial [Verrucomicrobiota bacterium]